MIFRDCTKAPINRYMSQVFEALKPLEFVSKMAIALRAGNRNSSVMFGISSICVWSEYWGAT